MDRYLSFLAGCPAVLCLKKIKRFGLAVTESVLGLMKNVVYAHQSPHLAIDSSFDNLRQY